MATSLGVCIPFLAVGRAAMGAFLALAVLLMLRRIYQDRSILKCFTGGNTLLKWTLLGMGAWLLVSSFASIDIGQSLKTFLRTAALIYLSYEVARQLGKSRQLLLLCLRAMLISSAVIHLVIFGIIYLDERLITLPAQYFGESVHMGLLFKSFFSAAVCLIPFYVWIARENQNGYRWLAIATTILTLANVWHDGENISRSASMGLLGGFILVLLAVCISKYKNMRSPITLTSLFLISAGLVLFFVAQLPVPPYDGLEVRHQALPFPDLHRQIIWGYVSNLAVEQPFLGIGMNTINTYPPAQEKIYVDFGLGAAQWVEFVPSHPHNWALEVASETGIPGLLLILAVIAALIGRFIVFLRGPMHYAAVTGLFVIGAFWTSSMFNFSIWSSWWLSSFFVLLGISLAGLNPMAVEDRADSSQ